MTENKIDMKAVTRDEADTRLDRWFKRHYPDLTYIALEKLLRGGQIRVDGKRAKSNDRLLAGQQIRIPPLPKPAPKFGKPKVPEKLVTELMQAVLYKDDDVIVLNKPFGLAVQGGTKTAMHLDAALEELKFGLPDKPKLVHRLDKDTAGVVVLARNTFAAGKLTGAFRSHKVRKYYWTVTCGVARPNEGRIDMPLAKDEGSFEKMAVNNETGEKAVTYYSVVEDVRQAAFVALWPITGRTHQLRVHMAAIGTPMLGDPKYGDRSKEDFLIEADLPNKLHLFARRIIVPHPRKGFIDATAPLPPHMKKTWDYFNFSKKSDGDPFVELVPEL